jgi:uncharacterized protein (DUF488 family)
MASGQRIYTIGHSSTEPERLIDALRANAIASVVDVRTYPVSRFAPQFNRPALESHLTATGIEYVSLGHLLGGRPAGADLYDDDGHVLYWKVARTPAFEDGLYQLRRLAARTPTAVMCSEEDPAECHRRLLIGRVLMAQGSEVVHIRAGGVCEEDSLERLPKSTLQASLFGGSEEHDWKSIRSVSPKRLQPSSLAH